eukprot:scaffold1311_cov256-Pinguiococcus_pyrenoidosus.AAC.35
MYRPAAPTVGFLTQDESQTESTGVLPSLSGKLAALPRSQSSPVGFHARTHGVPASSSVRGLKRPAQSSGESFSLEELKRYSGEYDVSTAR